MLSSGFAHGAQIYAGKTPTQNTVRIKKSLKEKKIKVHKPFFTFKRWIIFFMYLYL